MKNKLCSVCNQKIDVYTTAHKNHPFVNNKFYDVVCFTCYFVPKLSVQKYDKNGDILEDIGLPYSCENLNTPQELYLQGASDSLKQAKISVEAVKSCCKSCKKHKKEIFRPSVSWNIL